MSTHKIPDYVWSKLIFNGGSSSPLHWPALLSRPPLRKFSALPARGSFQCGLKHLPRLCRNSSTTRREPGSSSVPPPHDLRQRPRGSLRSAVGSGCARIGQIDHLISVQLIQAFHDPAFRKLEASWRGLYLLVQRTRKAEHVRVRLLNLTKKELLTQLYRERERYSSSFARKGSGFRFASFSLFEN
jgi:hypothetical protein